VPKEKTAKERAPQRAIREYFSGGFELAPRLRQEGLRQQNLKRFLKNIPS
jgi:hypothetical protein